MRPMCRAYADIRVNSPPQACLKRMDYLGTVVVISLYLWWCMVKRRILIATYVIMQLYSCSHGSKSCDVQLPRQLSSLRPHNTLKKLGDGALHDVCTYIIISRCRITDGYILLMIVVYPPLR